MKRVSVVFRKLDINGGTLPSPRRPPSPPPKRCGRELGHGHSGLWWPHPAKATGSKWLPRVARGQHSLKCLGLTCLVSKRTERLCAWILWSRVMISEGVADARFRDVALEDSLKFSFVTGIFAPFTGVFGRMGSGTVWSSGSQTAHCPLEAKGPIRGCRHSLSSCATGRSQSARH